MGVEADAFEAECSQRLGHVLMLIVFREFYLGFNFTQILHKSGALPNLNQNEGTIHLAVNVTWFIELHR
jgi:hypothetical protein